MKPEWVANWTYKLQTSNIYKLLIRILRRYEFSFHYRQSNRIFASRSRIKLQIDLFFFFRLSEPIGVNWLPNSPTPNLTVRGFSTEYAHISVVSFHDVVCPFPSWSASLVFPTHFSKQYLLISVHCPFGRCYRRISPAFIHRLTCPLCSLFFCRQASLSQLSPDEMRQR